MQGATLPGFGASSPMMLGAPVREHEVGNRPTHRDSSVDVVSPIEVSGNVGSLQTTLCWF